MIYGEPKKLPDGRYYLKVSTDDGNRCMVQLNNTNLLTKFSESENVTLSLTDKSLEKIQAINTENITQAKENSELWFGRKVSDKTIDAAYTPNVKDNTLISSKATVNKNVVTRCYDHEKNLINLEDLNEDVKCDVIIEFSGLWFMKKTFGPIWRLAQIRLKAPPKKLYPDDYLFAESDDDSNSPEENDEDYI
jgi:hypothetical protein